MSWIIIRRAGIVQACGPNDGNFVPYVDVVAGDVLTVEETAEWPVPDIPTLQGTSIELVALAVPQAI